MSTNNIGASRRIYRVVLVSLFLFFSLVPPGRASAQPAEAYSLVEAVNTYRESVGLPRLTTNSALMVAAQRHVAWMASNYTYSHTGEGGSSPQSRAAAAGFTGTVRENVAGSTFATPGEVVFFWDQSTGHRQTMRWAEATHIGAGFAYNADQRLFVLLIGYIPGSAAQPTTQPIAGGTPAIDFTPLPGMAWSVNDGPLQEHYYDPAPVSPEAGGVGQAAASPDGITVPTEIAYVMPFDFIQTSEPRPDGSIVHAVEFGQTAWAIATRYGIDLETLLALNNLPENPMLYPGDELIIHLGEGQSPPAALAEPAMHTVSAGESLWTIAALHGLSVDELLEINDLPPDAVLQPGDQLALSRPAPTSTVLPSTATATISPPTATNTITAAPPTATATTPPALPTTTPGGTAIAAMPDAPPPTPASQAGADATESARTAIALVAVAVLVVVFSMFGTAIIRAVRTNISSRS